IGWLFWKKYLAADLQTISATRREWTWLFWWSIFTHPVLDSFTTFGTQLFQPFSDYRVAFNNIAVVDPAYTVPFLLCLLAASFISREKKARRILNWFGIGLSSAYMVFTLVHKWQFDRLFERSLAEQGIVTQRFTASPTILNNFLWQGMAESDTAYYHGMYSFFDKEPRITQFHVVPKNHELVAKYEGDRAMRILRWFSNGYFNVITRKDGKLQLNDLRYGSREERFEKETDYIFRFVLEEKDGKLSAHQTREGDEITGEAFQKLFNRILGKK
ncbi:MAG: metal-dependent hydrolase, partial [Bacteroidota bacterium]